MYINFELTKDEIKTTKNKNTIILFQTHLPFSSDNELFQFICT